MDVESAEQDLDSFTQDGPALFAEVPSVPAVPDAPLALYRRYRPEVFSEVIGQEHVTEPLKRALAHNRVNHAYLFSGPRGCGKTSSARILARSLNCEQGPTPDPCGVCQSCRDLARGGPGSIDVIEIDAASHGGVDDARDLRERAFFAPVHSRYKIYIIDEAHMVTAAGFNALLKLVEEPPPHVMFIFATTEPDKVIGTIRSRTHHYPFRLIPPKTMTAYLNQICEEEHVHVEPGVIPMVVRAGGGSVRDSLSVLDQLFGGADDSGVGYAQAAGLLGYTPDSLLDDVVDAIADSNAGGVFASIDKVIETGQDPRRFTEDLLTRLRDLVIVAAVPDALTSGLLDVPDDQAERYARQAKTIGVGNLTRAAEVLAAGLVAMRGTTTPRLQLELMCARILLPGADGERGFNARLERIERRLDTAGRVGTQGGPVTSDQSASTSTVNTGSGTPAPAGQPTGAGFPAGQLAGTGHGTPDVGEQQSGPSTPQTTGDSSAAGQGGPSSAGPSSPGGPSLASQSASTDAVPATSQSSAGQSTSRTTGPDRPSDHSPKSDGHSSDSGQFGGTGPDATVTTPGTQSGAPATQPAGNFVHTEEVTGSGTQSGVPTHSAEQPVTAGRTSQSVVPPTQPASPAQAAQAEPAAPVSARPPAQQSAPPTSPAPASTLTTEEIRRAWPRILGRVSAARRYLWMILNQYAAVTELSGTTLWLTFSDPGSRDNFNRSGGEEMVSHAVKDELGITVVTRARLESEPIPADGKTAILSLAKPVSEPAPGLPNPGSPANPGSTGGFPSPASPATPPVRTALARPSQATPAEPPRTTPTSTESLPQSAPSVPSTPPATAEPLVPPAAKPAPRPKKSARPVPPPAPDPNDEPDPEDDEIIEAPADQAQELVMELFDAELVKEEETKPRSRNRKQS